ncbi:MAG: hypothetical protein ACQESR_16325 [Planctomycetota bacterium]
MNKRISHDTANELIGAMRVRYREASKLDTIANTRSAYWALKSLGNHAP